MFMAIEQMRAIVELLTSGGAINGLGFAALAYAIVMMIRNVGDQQEERERRERDGG